jgi:hypothetical protein
MELVLGGLPDATARERWPLGTEQRVQQTGQTLFAPRDTAAAGLELKAHPHMLRHACGYALANKGHDTRAAARPCAPNRNAVTSLTPPARGQASLGIRARARLWHRRTHWRWHPPSRSLPPPRLRRALIESPHHDRRRARMLRKTQHWLRTRLPLADRT